MINEKQYSLVAEPIDTKQLKKTFASISGLTRVAVLKNDNLDYRQSPCCVRSNIFCPFHYIDLRLRVKNKTIGSKICSVSYQDCPESEILSENEPKVFHEDMDEYLLYLDDILMKEAYVTHRLYIKFDCEQTVKELAPGDVYIEWFPGEVSHESTDRFIELFYPQSKESARKHISQFDLRYALLMLPTCTKYTNGNLMVGMSGMKAFNVEQEIKVCIFDSEEPETRKTKLVTSSNHTCITIYADENELLSVCENVPHRVGPLSDFVMLTNPPCKNVFVEKSCLEQVIAYLKTCNIYQYIVKSAHEEIEKTDQEYNEDVAKELERAEFQYSCYMFYRDGGEKTEERIWKSTGTNEPPMP